jgi:2-polyprenyl-3-methyl-5-hydroxy-6-metoxy-1,4-benzoquinol methylase
MNYRKCPVCNAQKIISLRKLKGKRTGNLFNLYYCNTCYSMFNPSGYQENDCSLKVDLKWHISKFDSKGKNALKLIQQLMKINPDAKTFLDIGCGIGATILQAQSLGLKAEGVEPNYWAVNYAKENFSLDLKCDYFQENLYEKKFDLIICDQVLEHLENPQQLFKAAIASLNRPGIIYLSVPFRKDFVRQLIYTAFPNLPGTLFFDNDVHITHFSHKSMKLWAKEFQADSCQLINYGRKKYIFSFKGYVFSFI